MTRQVIAIECICERCGASRVVTKLPKTCHICRTRYWNTPRKNKPIGYRENTNAKHV